MKNDSLGDRMKGNYENRSRFHLTRRTPVIIRLDGKAFHTFTKGCQKPFDVKIIKSMEETCKYLVENIQGCKMGYVQSDEISLLLTDYDKLNTDAYFDYNIQKICSISASMASVNFTISYGNMKGFYQPAHFDSRCFNIPKEEVINYFRWRYQDWLRNSIQMLAQSLYSHKELHGKKTPDLHDLCFQKGKNWNDLEPQFKNGTLFIKDGETIRPNYDFNLMSPWWLEYINGVVEQGE